MRVFLLQILCPDRHCMFALVYEAEPNDQAEHDRRLQQSMQAIGNLIQSKAYNPWCGLCGAAVTTWIYELGLTPFTTHEEAAPHVAAMQLANIESAERLHQQRRTFDATRSH